MTADDEFQIDFLGKPVTCFSLDDAVAVKAADDILSGTDPTPYPSRRLLELAVIVERYELSDAGARLRKLAKSARE